VLPTDAAAVSNLFEQFGYPASAGRFEARLSKLLADTQSHIVVAEEAGQVIAVGMLRTVDILEGDDPLGVLLTLVVDETFRRKGVGTQVVEALERFARDRGCFGIVVQSGSRRIAGHALYRKLNYLQTGERFIKIFDRDEGP